MMLESVVKSPIASVIGNVLTEPPVRYFSLFDNVAETQIELSPVITLDGDFEIEVWFMWDGELVNQIILGYTESTNPMIALVVVGDVNVIRFRDASANLINTSLVPEINKLNKLNITRSGTLTTLNLNGTYLATTELTSNFLFNKIGGYGSTGVYTFNSYMANLKIWTGGNKTTGTCVLDMPLNAKTPVGRVVHNRQYVPEPNTHSGLDQPLDTTSVFLTTAGSSDLSVVDGGVLLTRLTTDSSWGLRYSKTFTVGESYIVDIEYEDLDGWVGSISAYPYSHDTASAVAPAIGNIDNRISFIFTATETDNNLSIVFIVSAISADVGKRLLIKKYDIRPVNQSLGQPVNFVESDFKRFTFDTDWGWLGNELITQDVWENPNSVGSQWTYDAADNTWNLDSDGTYNALSIFNSGTYATGTYLLSASTLENTSTIQATNLTSDFALVGDYASVEGVYQYDTHSDVIFKRAASESMTSKVVKASFKELIEVAS
jgi:hypothetical protein